MTTEPELRERAEGLIAEFMNLVRVQIDSAGQSPGSGQTESERLWNELYGSVEVEGKSYEEVFAKLSTLVQEKLFMAATVAMVLAAELAEAEGGKLADVLDRVELKLSKMLGMGQLP